MRKEAAKGKDYSYSKLLEQDKGVAGIVQSRQSQSKDRCTFYVYPDQNLKLDELSLKLRQVDPKLRLDKSSMVRVALDLLTQLMEATDLNRTLALYSGGDLEEALPRLLLSELASRRSKAPTEE